jgi:hypothetical protein
LIGGANPYNGYDYTTSGNDGIGFDFCNDITLPVITELGGGEGNGKTTTIGNAIGFRSCVNVDRPDIKLIYGNNGGKGKAYGFYSCINVIYPKAVMLSSDPSYMHYMWSGLIVNLSGSAAYTALFNPLFGPYQLLLLDTPAPGQSVTLSWQFISPDGATVSKSAILQVSVNKGATWTNIYTGTNTSYTYNIPLDTPNIQFRLNTSGSGYAYTDMADFTAMPAISGADSDI